MVSGIERPIPRLDPVITATLPLRWNGVLMRGSLVDCGAARSPIASVLTRQASRAGRMETSAGSPARAGYDSRRPRLAAKPAGGSDVTWNAGCARGSRTTATGASRCSCARPSSRRAGYSDDALDRPIVGIADTFSDFNPCHGNVPHLIEAVKRGVMLAGGLPMDFPTISHPRELLPPDQHVPAQPDGDGHRGDDPRPADGRGGADRRLRQDHSGAADGRGLADMPGHRRCRPGRCWSAITRASVLGACTDCRRLWARVSRRRDRRGRDRGDQRPPGADASAPAW